MDYESILDNISEGVFTVDNEMVIQVFNSAAERITGFPAEEVMGKHCSEVLCEDKCPLTSAIESGESISDYEAVIARKDGSEIPVRISANVMRDQDGETVGAVGSFRDITEIKNLTWEVVEKHTMALEEKTKLEIILDSIAEGVFTINDEWRIDSFNAAAERITGFAAEEAMGLPCREIFRSDMCGRNCALAQSLESGTPISNCEVNITSKDGRRIPISVSTAILMDDDGEVIGAVESFRDLSEIKRLAAEVHERYEFSNIVGKSRGMQRIFDLIGNLADTDATVLIQGQSGTGKELIARAIHYNSLRKNNPFVAVSCAALAENILESELFGHVKGAFSDAIMNKAGRFEMADGGTLFLDEIGEISPNIQVKLLRALETQEFERVGGTKTVKVDIRLVAASNRDLRKAMEEGDFREDLFYRLNVVPIYIPPLRERGEDIPLLIEHFTGVFNEKMGKNIISASPEAMDLLLDYPWPGNVRELQNAMEHAFVHCRSDTILPKHLPDSIHGDQKFVSNLALLSDNPLNEAERQVILGILEEANWDQIKAMKRLKISRTTLWRKMRKYGISGTHNS
ncbi:sigma 54-interacting transcriptional regulator [Candidatus Poribacteria bacterium]